ncbi:MAG: ISNCY family transposase [Rhodoferax sp.]|nr:ISNCY family transposase [Rhodoferax sp.]
MRVTQNQQMLIGEVDVSKVSFDLRSRDDIPKILRGLQHIYSTETLRENVFALLEKNIAPTIDKANGRPGMTLWRILVCGVVRLDLNCDYDRLLELVNQHLSLREMLGHGPFDEHLYSLQSLKDNVRLLTPELLDQINQIVVAGGHVLAKKSPEQNLRGRCDSFVLETHVHFPTDLNLLMDAMRKIVTLTTRLCESQGVAGWRQHAYLLKQINRHARTAQNKKRSKAKLPQLLEKNQQALIEAHQDYLHVAQSVLDKARASLAEITLMDSMVIGQKQEIEGFMVHADRQIEQIHRRVILGQPIAHGEKVFSIFEPHTEWISKGKAGVPVELGLKVCILEDQHQFILHHKVMEHLSDEQVALEMVSQAKNRFPSLAVCSFDKGFHSKANQEGLNEYLEQVVLPRKGKLSRQAKETQSAPEFVRARRAHSAVESAINGLEVHGLDVCLDHGIEGFKRYVAWAVVARNIHRIGAMVWQQDVKQEQRRRDKQAKSEVKQRRRA